MTVPSELATLPPSAKLAYAELCHHEPLTYSALRTETELSDSTLKFALDQLKERGALEKRSGEYRVARR